MGFKLIFPTIFNLCAKLCTIQVPPLQDQKHIKEIQISLPTTADKVLAAVIKTESATFPLQKQQGHQILWPGRGEKDEVDFRHPSFCNFQFILFGPIHLSSKVVCKVQVECRHVNVSIFQYDYTHPTHPKSVWGWQHKRV